MIQIRKAGDRGHFDFGWLSTYHTFSFGDYYDPAHMGFRSLRVINEDWVQPGQGFGTHPHRDMEIVTYVLDGALKHEDSMGNGSIIRPGEAQRMSAGSGITHSEFNASKDEPVHLLQIWILPERKGIEPGYEQKPIDLKAAKAGWKLIASKSEGETSVRLNQDVKLFVTLLGTGEGRSYFLGPDRHAWVHVARGSVRINGNLLGPGDGAAVSSESQISMEAAEPAEILLFDLN